MASALFQYSSKDRDSFVTTGPATKTSSSPNCDCGSTWKYRSPMLRPPTSAIELPSIGERIEDPDVNVRVCAQRCELVIDVVRFRIVDQQPHANPAVRRTQQLIRQQLPSLVLAKDEVLEIEGPRRRLDHLRANEQAVHASG
jgi:hypothetical protein